MNLIEEIKDWQQNDGVETFRQMGVKSGDTVIDFGSGKGRYTITLANTVGKNGKVYALDISQYALRELKRENPPSNVYPVHTNHQGILDFEDESVDFIMIYDLIHQIDSIRTTFIQEAYRVLKKGGRLSVLPFHVSSREYQIMSKQIMDKGFREIEKYPQSGIHFEMHEWLHGESGHLKNIERGTIYNYKK